MDVANNERVSKHDVTHINLKEFVYTWQITNFKFYGGEIGKELNSLTFVTGDNNEYEFRLSLYSNGYDESSQDYLSVALYMVKEAPEKKIYLILSLVDRDGEESRVSVEKFIDLKHNYCTERLFKKFVKKSTILDPNNLLLPNETLTLRCKLYFVDNIIHLPYTTNTILPTEQMLSNDLERLLDNTKFSDAKLIVGDKVLNVHKSILSARSRVFAIMFEHNMREQLEDTIVIRDFDYETMQHVLYFMYTGRIKEDTEITKELVIAADIYELEGLKTLCEDLLIINLSVENVCKVLSLANTRKLNKLETAAIKFVENHASLLANSEKFKEDMTLVSPLLAKLLSAFLSKI